MKKALIAAAVMACGGAASAQSSVTLFGIVDATVAYGSGDVSNRKQLTHSGYNSSRLGFRGVEDLGGGLMAGFWLESAISNDTGTGGATNTNNQPSGATTSTGLTFNRRATVGVGGPWGEIRFGRDYSPQFWNLSVYDPFNTNGVGNNQVYTASLGGPTNPRASNTLSYLYGHAFNAVTSAGGQGLHVLAQYYLGENPSGTPNSDDGTGGGLRVGYNQGPLSLGVTAAKTQFATGDITTINAGGSYHFGVLKVMAAYDRDRVAAPASVTGKGYILGVSVPVGAHELRAGLSDYRTTAAGSPGTRKLALGYVHNLSKRTALYTTLARIENRGGNTQALNGAVVTANGSSNGVDLGIRHSF